MISEGLYERLSRAAAGELVELTKEEFKQLNNIIVLPKEAEVSALEEAKLDEHFTILDKAKAAVYGDRERDYGPVEADMKCIAAMWTAILGMHVEPHHVPLCMVALKLARLTYSINHNDSLVDVAGWAAVLERLLKEQADAIQDKR